MVEEDAVEDEGVVLMAEDTVGEFAGAAAKGEVTLFFGNKDVVDKFTEEAVDNEGGVLSAKDVVNKFTGVVSTETKDLIVDVTLTDTVAKEKAVNVGVLLLAKDKLGKFPGMVSTAFTISVPLQQAPAAGELKS